MDTSVHEIYGIAKQQMAAVLLHAAAFDNNISKVALIAPYSSYRSIVLNLRYKPAFLHSTVPGSISIYDLPDLAAALAPKKLLLTGITDGNGNNSNTADIDNDLSIIKAAYRRHSQELLQIIPPSSFEQLTGHLINWLGK